MSTGQGFAIWITGIPASGNFATRNWVKNCLNWVIRRRAGRDKMRTILTPVPTYDEVERDAFYRSLAQLGGLITRNGVPVIFDATANKRVYRDYARSLIPRFVEVYVVCPLEICVKRDPKGIYGRAAKGMINTVPGVRRSMNRPITRISHWTAGIRRKRRPMLFSINSSGGRSYKQFFSSYLRNSFDCLSHVRYNACHGQKGSIRAVDKYFFSLCMDRTGRNGFCIIGKGRLARHDATLVY